jgi:signal transduction histidine kinase
MSARANNTDRIRILLIEDDEDDFIVARRLLSSIYGEAYDLTWVKDYEGAVAALRQDASDVCLLDFRMGAHDGLEILRAAGARDLNVPIILMTGQGDREIDVEAMQAGASDYLVKGSLDSADLERSIRYAIQHRKIREARTKLVREQEKRARAEEANRLKDEFLATVSHELRTPLNAIVGWVSLLRSGKLEEEQFSRALETIERNARAQSQLIDDLLDVSRIASGKLRLSVRPADLRSVIESALDTVRPAADAKSIRLTASLNPNARLVSGDVDRLQQIVWNLLNNAIKFTPQGGSVEVRLERVESHVEISVTDTGEGIAPDFLPYVFERFRQADSTSHRSHRGLGLGLSIVRQLAELHGGSVSADSPGPGKGSTFSICLPVPAARRHSDDDANAAPGAPSEGPSLADVRVLLVDDEPDAREVVSLILGERGAQVRAVSSATDALAALDTYEPNVIVSDIEMPGEDGYSLIRRIRLRDPERGGLVPAAALTAYSRSQDRMLALSAAFQIHVPKPIEPAELVAAVWSLSRRHLS